MKILISMLLGLTFLSCERAYVEISNSNFKTVQSKVEQNNERTSSLESFFSDLNPRITSSF
jgi:hypothetical protein